MKSRQRAILIIMDGWGHGPKPEASAIAQGNTPFIDSLYKQYPNTELVTYGEAVGLPKGQMGNSEVGHLNIGAGRIVYQELLRINRAIDDGSFFRQEALLKAFHQAKESGKPLHFIGLLSEGGIHSHIEHLKALCKMAKEHELPNAYIHAFMDGRDTDPKSGLRYLEEIEAYIAEGPVEVASISGRYFGMDRDNRWPRIKKAYDCLCGGIGNKQVNLAEGLKASYENGITDEFVEPIVKVGSNGEALAQIRNRDIVICFNFRTDRCRQITKALTQEDMPAEGMKALQLNYVTMTSYDTSFKDIEIVFHKENLKNTLGEVIQEAGLKQIRIAETEKYPHVTYFFSGGREEVFEGESRLMLPSPQVATYDLQPEMSAFEVRDRIVAELNVRSADFVCLNFANPDMVGHTGVLEAAVKAIETIDSCVETVVEAAIQNEYVVLLTADHGNADYMINEDGSPNTAHTMNPVPLFLIDPEIKAPLREGKLGDLAPTILTLMGMEVPSEMDGEVLI